MDQEFIRNAEGVKTFHLSTRDFQSTKHKSEIQHLFNKHFFQKLDLNKIPDNIHVDTINKLINELKKINKPYFEKLHTYNLKGIGPGEATLYFLCNKSELGGGSSAGIDIIVGSNKYEVKAVRVSSKGMMSDFKLGSTVALYSIQKQLNALRIKLNLPGAATNIAGSTIDKMRELASSEFEEIESEFSELAYDYFKGVDVIFINNTKASPKYGEIITVRSIGKDDIMIERMTNGTVKPKIQS